MNFSTFFKKYKYRWQKFIKSHPLQWRLLDADSSVMLVTSLIVGIGAGLGAVLFRRLIDWIHNFAYSDIAGIFAEWYPLHLIIIPALIIILCHSSSFNCLRHNLLISVPKRSVIIIYYLNYGFIFLKLHIVFVKFGMFSP